MATDSRPQTCAALLSAGLGLARQRGVAALSAAAVAQAAGLAESAFAACFASRSEYLSALAGLLMDEVRGAVADAIAGMPSGRARLRGATETYLDANFARPQLREMVMELRFDAVGAELIRSRIAAFAQAAQSELAAVGWPRPAVTARLLTIAMIEAATAEFEARRVLPEYRRTLHAYLGRH